MTMVCRLFLVLFFSMGTEVRAAEKIPENSLWQISQDVEVKEQAAESAGAVGNLKKGTPVIVIEEEEGNWCKIQYQEILGYIQKEYLERYGAVPNEELEQEFMKIQEESIWFEDEYELVEGQEKSVDLWKAMIVVFIAGIFGIGIFSAVKGNRDNDPG